MIEPLALGAVALVMLAGLARLIADGARASERSERVLMLRLAAAAAGVLVLRFAIARPTFLHANFHGSTIAEAILEYPRYPMGRDETFGHFGFLVLNACARVFGRRFEVVSAANQVFAAATLWLMAVTAYRYSRKTSAALMVLGAGALHVAVVRVAASEDAHNLAVLLMWLALWSIDVYAEKGARAALLVASASLVLVIHTRQTMFVILPCAYALALARGRRALFGRRELWLSALVVAAALGLRARSILGNPSEQVSFIIIGMILTTPSLLLVIARHHPLLDLVRFAPLVTLLLLIGLVVAWRQRGVARALVGSFVLCFILSLATAWHTPGVEYASRLPAVSLGLVLAGLGGSWLAERARRRTAGVALAVLVGLAPLATGSPSELRAQSADYLEYVFLRDHAGSLPRAIVPVTISTRDSMMPSYSPPLGLLRRAGIRLDEEGRPHTPPDEPRLFLAGVQCWAWSMGELLGFGRDPREVTRQQLEQWGGAAVSGDLRALSIPRTMRPECVRLLEGARPIGDGTTIEHPTQGEPFAIYGVDSVPVQWYVVARGKEALQ